MTETTLIIMAAGLGSRYGGLKQLDPIGPKGQIIIDYSIYDAIRSGFGRIVFIINRKHLEKFHESIGRKLQGIIPVDYVFQSLEDIPQGFRVPEGRIKPWGTAHALLACRDVVKTPFGVINADDFYGYNSFRLIHDFLVGLKEEKRHYAMAGFNLKNTLTENGYVSRGICTLDKEDYLRQVIERTKIKAFDDKVKYTEDEISWHELDKNAATSMNFWGLTPDIFPLLSREVERFLREGIRNPLKDELYLPSVINNMIKKDEALVKVLKSNERWYGVTYNEDKKSVQKAIKELTCKGLYPEDLWEV